MRRFLVLFGAMYVGIDAMHRRDVIARLRKERPAWRRDGIRVVRVRKNHGSFIRSYEGRRRLAFWAKQYAKEQTP